MRNVIGKIRECAVLNQQELADLHMMFHTMNPELLVEDLKEIYRQRNPKEKENITKQEWEI